MKTIAITMDEATLRELDALTEAGDRSRSRSALVREAVRAFLAERARARTEEGERAIIRKHRSRLLREARALLEDQAELDE